MPRIMRAVSVAVKTLLVLSYIFCFGALFTIYILVAPADNYGRPTPEGYDLEPDCDWRNITTSSITELTIPRPTESPSSAEVEGAIELVDHHGVGFFEGALSEETAAELRAYLVAQNEAKLTEFFVLKGKNRHHLRLGVHDDPILTKALIEVCQHKLLRPTMERLIGENAALVEVASITAKPGAVQQNWHPDCEPGDDPSTVVPLYSVFIPLQETTKGMGPTDVCPGTHRCMDNVDDNDDVCDERGVSATTPPGTAALMNCNTIHRGGGHEDEDAPERVMFYISFAGEPDGNRLRLPSLATFALRWDQWGHSLSDIDTLRERPWPLLDTFNSLRSKRGWTIQEKMYTRWANGDDIDYTDLDCEEWTDITWNLLKSTVGVSLVWAVMGLLLGKRGKGGKAGKVGGSNGAEATPADVKKTN